MKLITTLLLLLFSIKIVHSKTILFDSIPPHLKNLKLPDFKILLPDSISFFYKENLDRKKKYTLLMSFSPECDHCKQQTLEILTRIDAFKNAQIVMTTTLPFEQMKLFYTEFKIGAYKNIVLGRDLLFFFPRYYKNNSLPFLALYNKKGELMSVYDGGVRIETIINQLH